MKELAEILKTNTSFLRKLISMLHQNFDHSPVMRSEYRLFMAQRFHFNKVSSHEILRALKDAGFVKNGSRGIYIENGSIDEENDIETLQNSTKIVQNTAV
jgi:hypothetical protein